MNAKLLILLGIGALSAGLVWLDYRHGSAPACQMLAQAADFEIVPLEQGRAPLALSDLRGRFVLVNGWASWCPPCVKEFPDLLALAGEFPQTVTLVTLSADRTAQAARGFLARYGAAPANILHMFDVGRRIAREHFAIERYPETLLIDPQGRVLAHMAGVLNEADIQRLRRLITAK